MLDKTSEERRRQIMNNNYEVAEVIELGNAQDVVLGEKELAEVMDSQTIEFGTRFIPATND
jgi:hypothetical protein